MTKLLNWLK